MAGTKFSGFTTGATTANTLIVGYDSVAGTNNQYSLAQLAAGISPSITFPDTIFTTSPTATVPTGQVLTLTDSLKFESVSGSIYGGWVFTPALAGAGANDYATIKYGARTFISNYRANDGWAFGGTDTTNSFHFNTGTTTLSDGYAMRVHANTVSPYGALILKGYGTSTDKTFIIQDSGANETFSIQDDGVAKYSGQAYTELYDTANTTLTVDWNNGNVQELTGLTGSHTFTASSPKAGATYILTLAQTGAVTPTWTGVKWPAATAPTLSGAGKTDVITLICYDATGAGLYYGSSTLNFTT
tara:strand:+ start:712 stop:1614 length:903 start_codon:yes stop_codon:yes gene_type:complete